MFTFGHFVSNQFEIERATLTRVKHAGQSCNIADTRIIYCIDLEAERWTLLLDTPIVRNE